MDDKTLQEHACTGAYFNTALPQNRNTKSKKMIKFIIKYCLRHAKPKNILYHTVHEVNIITCVFGDADGSGWQVHPTVYGLPSAP